MNKRLSSFLSLFLLIAVSSQAAELTRQVIVNAGHNILYMVGIASTKPKGIPFVGSSRYTYGDMRPEDIKQAANKFANPEVRVVAPEIKKPEVTTTWQPVYEGQQNPTHNDGHSNVIYKTSTDNHTVSVGTDAGSVGNFFYDLGNMLFGVSKTEKRQLATEKRAKQDAMKKPDSGRVVANPDCFLSPEELAAKRTKELEADVERKQKEQTLKKQIITLEATTLVLTDKVTTNLVPNFADYD